MTQENDKIIAEFMGVEKENGLYLFTTPMDDYKTDTLYFDVSWDWIYQVVHKIEELREKELGLYDGYTMTIYHDKVVFFDNHHMREVAVAEGHNRLLTLYDAVVKFIIFYNETKKDYNAKIKWLDSGDIRDVIITTKEVGEDDDQIFFYFESEEEIKEYMKEGKNEFIILEYSEFNLAKERKV